MSSTEQPVAVLCRYRVKPGHQEDFEKLLVGHWNTLFGAGLTTDEPASLLRGSDKAGNVAYIERFSWKTPGSAGAAHESPEVMMVWEPMGALCEDMEFWHVEDLGK